MKHIKQYDKECILATIACIRSLPYSTVRAYAHKVAREVAQCDHYVDIFNKPKLVRISTVQAIVRRFSFRPSLFTITKPAQGRWFALKRLKPSQLYGTGIIFTQNENSTHVLAFQNGIVYDSNCPCALSTTDWKELRLSFSEEYVLRIVRNFNLKETRYV